MSQCMIETDRVWVGPMLSSDQFRMEDDQRSGNFPPPDNARRASGSCLCQVCGKEYRKHPCNDPWYDLKRLCNGDNVHL